MAKEIFALDIGTRKVMGIVARQDDDGALEILGSETIEHPCRPMLDGSIQDIEDVSRTVSRIKKALEERLKTKLLKTGVAVAGRNLLTYTSRINKELEFEQEITAAMVKELEMEAVDKIISDPGKNISRGFYCAGYSPVYYELEGNRLLSLVGHRGKTIACEVIVTLLPRVVLDSMFSVLKKSGLEPLNVTLEPIAAINAIVPQELRSLHIVLVDIGAGTSDIALTQDGFVYGYDMVSLAGDEITEHICQELMTDFLSAENIKRSLNKDSRVEYEDIWGKKCGISREELSQKVLPAVKKLAQAIAERGLGLSGCPPQAVILVGGGSLTYNLIPELSRCLGLAEDKIGFRLPRSIKAVKNLPEKLNSPDAVTPLGIAMMTARSQGLNFIEVTVNGQTVQMLDFCQKKDILGAITLSGALNNQKLYPRPGEAISCYVNGELRFIKGSLGLPARITLNGQLSQGLSQKINPADRIEFEPAVDGSRASLRLKELLNLEPVSVTFNGQQIRCLGQVIMNGKEASPEEIVFEHADIQTREPKISDALRLKGIDINSLFERQILVNINSSPRVLTQANYTLRLNSSACGLDSRIKNEDAIEFRLNQPTGYRIKDVADIPEGGRKMRVNVDGKEITLEIEPCQIFMNGQNVSGEEFLIDGAEVKVYYLKDEPVMLSEIFRYIELAPQKALGKRMRILLDGRGAGFTTPLSEGQKVNILFEDREDAEE